MVLLSIITFWVPLLKSGNTRLFSVILLIFLVLKSSSSKFRGETVSEWYRNLFDKRDSNHRSRQFIHVIIKRNFTLPYTFYGTFLDLVSSINNIRLRIRKGNFYKVLMVRVSWLEISVIKDSEMNWSKKKE